MFVSFLNDTSIDSTKAGRALGVKTGTKCIETTLKIAIRAYKL